MGYSTWLPHYLDALWEGVIMVDDEWRVQYVNQFARQWVRTDCNTILGRSFWECYSAANEIRDFYEDAMRHRVAQTRTRVLGQQRLLIRVFPQQPTGLLILFLDQTDQHQQEATLNRFYQGQHAFFNATAHEIRTPLTALMMSTRLLERAIGQPDREARAQSLLPEMRRQMQRIDLTLSRILDVTAILTGTFTIQLAPGPAHDPIMDALADLHAVDRFQVTLPKRLPLVNRDPERLYQTVRHIAENALRYSDGPIRVQAKTRRRTRIWSLDIHDTGVGIQPERLATLFNLWQVPSLTWREGMGLGLFIAHHIVERHEGALHVHSVPNQGSTFSVTLPLLAPTH